MSDRERLIEVMARAIWDDRNPESMWPYGSEIEQNDYRGHAVAAIEAAERAGFRWIGPDDGR